MGRVPCCDKSELRKGPWTPEEDLKLTNYIQIHGPGNWRTLPKNAGLQRCGKSCRLRWANYLRPDIRRGRFTLEEEDIIIQLHSVLGNKWSAIAARLPGRTDNEIKNYWNTHIKKRLLRMGIDPVTHAPRLDLFDMSFILRSVLGNPSLLNMQGLLGAQVLMNPHLWKLAATVSLLSIQNENTDLTSSHKNHFATPQELTQFQTPMEAFLCDVIPNSPLSSAIDKFQGVHNENQNMGFADSVVGATPFSSPKQLNSSSNYGNSGMVELERDSYCGESFQFEIPESLDISDFFCSVPHTN